MVRPPPALSALSLPAISLLPYPRLLVFRVFSYSPLSLIHRFFLFRTFFSSPILERKTVVFDHRLSPNFVIVFLIVMR
jgi:hypothetical protein